MKFENTSVYNIYNAILGARNPMNSWNKSDSIFKGYNGKIENTEIGENDIELMQKLIKAGSEHRKFMRQIFVSVDITAPLYFYKELDTYKVGTVANSTSTMHKLASTPITIDCFECGDLVNKNVIRDLEKTRQKYLETKAKGLWKYLIVNLPESWLQKRTVTMNYENILNMIHQRKNHKLTEWSVDFISWGRSLPYAQELFFELEEKKYSIVSGGFDPLHKGHIELIKDAAKISKDGVIVIMNSDEWLRERKHRPLLQRESREAVLRSIKGVVDIIYDDFDVDGTVKVALSKIREKYPMAQLSFCNGGGSF